MIVALVAFPTPRHGIPDCIDLMIQSLTLRNIMMDRKVIITLQLKFASLAELACEFVPIIDVNFQ
jgi:hypothetical protein